MSISTSVNAIGPGDRKCASGRLQLYVAHATPNSTLAEQNLLDALRGLDDGGAGLELEIIDVFTNPLRALTDGVIVTPTLVGLKRNERLIITGDLTDTAKLRFVLVNLQDDKTIEAMTVLISEKEALLADKAILADEMTHRVRNNLQLVEGLLTAHRKILSDPDEKASVDSIINRVGTLAAMYDQLLGAGMGRTIDLGDYIKSICESLPGLQMESKRKATLTCVTNSMLVGLNTVTMMGMAVVEAVANSYKHAFHDGLGTINVCLRRSETSSEAILTVSDNGPGFIEQPGSQRHGVGLIRRLVQQARGSAELHLEQGTVWKFRFPVEPRLLLAESQRVLRPFVLLGVGLGAAIGSL